jgi:hypothetical protein
MKSPGVALVITLLLLLCCADCLAQETVSAAQEAQQLRNELRQLRDREAQIQAGLVEIDYELKPENIERYFAGVGSTRPEELRETRRKKLQAEKDRMQANLSEIAQERSRLEAAILNADTRVYYDSAMSGPGSSQNRMSPLAALLVGRNRKVAAVVVVLMLVGVIVAFARRNKHRTRIP